MRTVARLIERFTRQLGVLGGFATLMVMIVIILDVAGRTFFNAPIPGGNELSELLLVVLIFLGLAAAQQGRNHYTVDIVTHLLGPVAQRRLETIGMVVSLLVVGLLAWLSAKHAWQAMLQGESSYGTISFPIWPARVVIAFGLGLLALQLIIDIVKTLCSLDRPAEDDTPTSPVG